MSKKKTRKDAPPPVATQIVSRIWSMPRLLRIFLAALVSLLITLMIGLVFYLIDNRFLIPQEGQEIGFILFVPVIASTVGGLVAYLIGWRRLVDVQEADTSARNRVLWYLGVGLFALFFDAIWFVNVLNVINAPV